MRRDRGHAIRLTPSQLRLLKVVKSFGRPATEKEIELRRARTEGRLKGRRNA